jgi:peptidoglycan/LPS O-acetylase OafA/YrhL
MALATGNKTRIPALDFTKGALVLIMVLYHWLNYFVGPGGDMYRYLRFLTPSFIFITGFLISNVYLAKYQLSDSRVPYKLVIRGLKILGLFVLLNLARSLLLGGYGAREMLLEQLSASRIMAIYGTGNVFISGIGKVAAFYILVPIAYLLILSGWLLLMSRFYKHIFHAVGTFFLLCIFIMQLNGFKSANLELVTIGLLGVICGYVAIKRINSLVRRPYVVILAYCCYLIAISVWNVTFPLQVIGVCLSLALIYRLGTAKDEDGILTRVVILLGKYSLFGYIAQIAVLQVLRRGLGAANLGPAVLGISFLSALVLTVTVVEVVDRARARATVVNRLYAAVFS